MFLDCLVKLTRLPSPCRLVKHSMSGGGRNMRGFDALDMDFIGRGIAGGRLGRYDELRYLPDKVARFLFEFYAMDYKDLQLPAYPSTASSGTIHKLLKTHNVCPASLHTKINARISKYV
jgi:hypothetical protein